MKKGLFWIILLIIVVVLIAVFNKNKGTDETGPIKIGFIGPLSGEAAPYGDLYKAGVEFAIEDSFKKDVEVIFEDGVCNGTDAVSAAQKLINIDKVNAIIGGFCSGETLSFISLVDQNKIPTLTSGSSQDIFGKSNYVFQTWPTDSYGGLLLSGLVKKYNHNNVMVLSANTDYSLGISNVFVENYDKIKAYEKFNDGQTDFRDVVAKIKENNADAVVIITQTPKDLIVLGKQISDAGLTPQIYNAYHNSEDILKAPQLQNMRMVEAPIIENDSKNLVSRFKEKYGVEPAIPYAIATGYDSFNILVDAFTKEGKDSEKVISYLDNLNDYQGTSGNFSFVENQIYGLDLPFKELVDGKLIDIK